MSSFNIGLSGLKIAQMGLNLVGTNIANASTDGYHTQEMEVAPISTGSGSTASIGGAQITGFKRNIDSLLENQILSQQPGSSQVDQELSTLQSLQNAMGDTTTGGLAGAINTFFNSITQAAAQPASDAMSQQVVSDADTMASQFNQLGQFIANLQDQIQVQAQQLTGQINGLTAQVAQLNVQIEGETNAGQGAGNMLCDQRDEAISQLSNLLQVQTSQNPVLLTSGLSAVGSPLVTQGTSVPISVGTDANGDLGVYVGDNRNTLQTDVQGGQLGALVNLYNNLIPQVQQQVNSLASQIAQQFNAVSSQGIGASGSFTDLTGCTMPAGTVQSWGEGVTAGNVYVRVTNQATGAVTQSAIAIDPVTDDLATIANKFDAVAGLGASVVDGQLNIAADGGYKFDFLPALQSTPATSTLSGTSAATLSGTYTGAANDVFTFTVAAGGTVGVDSGVSLQERNSAGQLVNTIQVGQGYAAGDAIDAGNGISLSLSAGTLVTGDNFTVNTIANSDTAGLLPALGINTLFQGNTALDLQVAPGILNNPSQLAAAQTPGGTDNLNLQKMLALQNANLPALDGTNFSDFYSQLMTNTGQQISVLQARQTSMNSMMQQLTQQQSTVSGVDINDETAKLMEYEQLFESMSKYVATSKQAVESLLQIIA